MPKGDFLGEFEQIVLLAILQLGAGAYGVSIADEIASRTERTPTMGAIHATLKRLERKKYVKSHLGEATSERGGKPKRLVEVTSAGVAALAKSREAMNNMLSGLSRRWGI